MRTIPVVGTVDAQPPLSEGVTTYVVEASAYWLCKNGEATYVHAHDEVSDGRYQELVNFDKERNARAWSYLESGGKLTRPFYGDLPQVMPTAEEIDAASSSGRWPVRVI